jgi:hypothetical protein
MQNNKTKKKNNIQFHLKGNDSNEPGSIEARQVKNITINKYYIYGIIILFTFIIYGNSIFNFYALDDKLVITENKFTQEGIHGIGKIFSYDSFKGYFEFKGYNENLLMDYPAEDTILCLWQLLLLSLNSSD